jgi:hypothetical protein
LRFEDLCRNGTPAFFTVHDITYIERYARQRLSLAKRRYKKARLHKGVSMNSIEVLSQELVLAKQIEADVFVLSTVYSELIREFCRTKPVDACVFSLAVAHEFTDRQRRLRNRYVR